MLAYILGAVAVFIAGIVATIAAQRARRPSHSADAARLARRDADKDQEAAKESLDATEAVAMAEVDTAAAHGSLGEYLRTPIPPEPRADD